MPSVISQISPDLVFVVFVTTESDLGQCPFTLDDLFFPVAHGGKKFLDWERQNLKGMGEAIAHGAKRLHTREDNILIYSKSQEEHEEHLRIVLQILKERKLYAKLKKCKFWLNQVVFLGHVISKDGIVVDPNKIEAVVNWDSPTNVSEEIILDLERMEIEVVMGQSEAYLPSLSVQPTLVERFKLSQADDSHLKKIMDEVRCGMKFEFSISEDGVLRLGSRLCVPNDPLIKKETLDEVHYSPYAIHSGSTKMHHALRENFWWNNMKREIAHIVEQCLTC
ncbi:uncharacterized protein LOC115985064 [Quercus lobata]|uniref:uncharacterized protein LOC115985064 n=1 Tax=Quercus lobata TaxID=97700 RepID=UPI0012469D05|nr:uncharacterized protein LOC115985064 [Quercus lobata]